ncbi:hypothetical protein [Burkholderia stagnalis]|uniref:hypothetical protein n=1 Tax=Burkholderia stagnalis TaxID=1503054 RepID=UPI0007561FEB|nr:hypothetical protein [Burkholderia stagnalis]KVO57188.1 hypothetical protein WT18_00130 [Burkholderia stagnalis]KVP08839.1 hypothetical protein WT20_21525 [Burkholderia stagnalis]KVW88463.1 hypothetical protein WT30_32150 [Burkholderia stagnalis]KWH69000.1 hypothetical protein WT66_29325 [Burkholderia stagnalis]
MGTLAILFAVILLLNLIPAFAPPTWMAMSWVGFNLSDGNPFVFAVVAACAATVGRLILAGFARTLVRGHWMRRADRENIDVVQAWLARRRRLTAGIFFLYALSPFPSNYLFIAYGLSGLPLRTIGAAFFVGRVVTYSVWAHIGRFAAERLDLESQPGGAYLSGYFVVSQIALLGSLYLLMKIDWRTLVTRHKLRWHRPTAHRDHDHHERLSRK